MPDFIRARREGQKEQRLQEIKAATQALFEELPYHAITLTVIANRLGCSRAQLYQYITTKEEIFLLLCEDKRRAYFAALQAAFPADCGYTPEVFAAVWAGLLNAHQDFLKYSSLLPIVIETNVSVERLAGFKQAYYTEVEDVLRLLETQLGLPAQKAQALYDDVYYHAVGLGSSCWDNPLIRQALEMLGRKPEDLGFRQRIRQFIEMCLQYYCGR